MDEVGRFWQERYGREKRSEATLPLSGDEYPVPQKTKASVMRAKDERRELRRERLQSGALPLFFFNSERHAGRLVYRVLNGALPAAAILTFVAGLLVMLGHGTSDDDVHWLLYVVLSVASIALHEVGHLIAGFAYGYPITDAGVLFIKPIFFGAYVAHLGKENGTKKETIQFLLAGIEMNLLLAGVFFLLAAVAPVFSFTMRCVAHVNVILVLLNLAPDAGLDGEAALSAWLGVKSIHRLAVYCFLDFRRVKKLFHAGTAGRLCLLVMEISRLGVALPLCLIWGVTLLPLIIDLLALWL